MNHEKLEGRHQKGFSSRQKGNKKEVKGTESALEIKVGHDVREIDKGFG